jgi:hypothetical protein
VKETSGYQGGHVPLEGYLKFAEAGSKPRERDGSDRFCQVLSGSVVRNVIEISKSRNSCMFTH